jgi:hypothetical protein
MPKNLNKVVLSKEAKNIVKNLNIWLIKNRKYKLAIKLKFFNQCISTRLKKEISFLYNKISRQFAAIGILFIKYLIVCTNKSRCKSCTL